MCAVDTGKRENTFGALRWNAFADTNCRKNALSAPRKCSQVEIADADCFRVPDERILHAESKNSILKTHFFLFLLLQKLLP